MIKIIAVDYVDAYALVQEGERKYAIRPPFKSKGQPISQETIEKAITKHGFLPEDKDFNDWSELIKYLSSKAIEHREKLGYRSPDSEKIRRLVRKAPLEQVEKYLSRIKNELIPNSEINAAESLLINLLNNPNVRRNDETFDNCTNLLEQCNELEKSKDALFDGIFEQVSLSERFPYAAELYPPDYVCNLAESVKNQRQLLVVGTV